MNEPGIWILMLVGLAGLSLFFSLNTTALRVLNRLRLQEACEDRGDEERANHIIAEAHDLATVCGFYRLVANLAILVMLLWWFASCHAMQMQASAITWSFIIAVAIQSIFSLAIPHAMARYIGERVLVRTYGLLRLCSIPAYPVLGMVKLYDALVRRLAGIAEQGGQEAREEKEEEFLSVVEQGKMEGIVDEEQQEMIENVLELSETTAENIMTPRTDVVAVSVAVGLQGVLDAIATGHSRIPVYEGTIDTIIGFIYAKDMLNEIGKKPEDFDMRLRMRAAYFVPETKPLQVLLHEFQNQKLHIAVVLDEYGGTAGLVTIEDILEELVGEIADEYEEAPAQELKRIDDATVEVDARIHIDELNADFEIELPEDEDYDTVGGFVFSHLGYIPKTGAAFEWRNLKFLITSAEARKINRIRIHKMPENDEHGNA